MRTLRSCAEAGSLRSLSRATNPFHRLSSGATREFHNSFTPVHVFYLAFPISFMPRRLLVWCPPGFHTVSVSPT